jgi:hypothetical protein
MFCSQSEDNAQLLKTQWTIVTEVLKACRILMEASFFKSSLAKMSITAAN